MVTRRKHRRKEVSNISQWLLTYGDSRGCVWKNGMHQKDPAVAICILISNRERFHGQYREIYRDAVCDDILHNETDVCAGHTARPTHGGAPAPPRMLGTAGGRGGPADREAKGNIAYNLAIILVFIRAPAALTHLNLLNTRRLVHFIKLAMLVRAPSAPLLSSLHPSAASTFVRTTKEKGGNAIRRGTPNHCALLHLNSMKVCPPRAIFFYPSSTLVLTNYVPFNFS